jgi:hypothetical protein
LLLPCTEECLPDISQLPRLFFAQSDHFCAIQRNRYVIWAFIPRLKSSGHAPPTRA